MTTFDEARAGVDGWLGEVSLKTGQCSATLRDQLARGAVLRVIDVHAVYDEIAFLEESAPRSRSGTKPAAPLRGRELRGLMHKHYQSVGMASFARNQLNHWQRPENEPRLMEIINEFIQDGHSGKLAHHLVLGAHTGRHGASQMTGEWIVYTEVSGVNYYLTLGRHDEPDADIRSRVMACFDEFPAVRTHLGW